MTDTNKINELTELYITREILCCDSMLISDLLSSYSREHETNNAVDAFSYDNITNAYDYSDNRLLAHIENNDDKEPIKQYLSDNNHISVRELSSNELRELADILDYDAEPQEIFEWYRVTEWLAKELEAVGEPILDNTYGYWWGRTCCGQMIIADDTIQQIAKKYI